MHLWWVFMLKIFFFVVFNILQGIFLYLFIKYNSLSYLGLLILSSLVSNTLILFYLNHKTRAWYIYNYMIAFIFIVLPALMASLYYSDIYGDTCKIVSDESIVTQFQNNTYSGIMVFFATLFLMVFANIQNFLEDTEFKEEDKEFKEKLKLYKPLALLFAFVGILAYAVPFATLSVSNEIKEILFICSYLSITMFAQIAVLFQKDLLDIKDIADNRNPYPTVKKRLF